MRKKRKIAQSCLPVDDDDVVVKTFLGNHHHQKNLSGVVVDDDDDDNSADKTFDDAFLQRKMLCCASSNISKRQNVTKDEQSDGVIVLPDCADDNSDKEFCTGATPKAFAYKIVSQLAAHCEACESDNCTNNNGYGREQMGQVTPQLIACLRQQQKSPEFLEQVLRALAENVANYMDFVALLRHRCVKLPLDVLAKILADNSLLFVNTLRHFMCAFGSTEFARTLKEQRKAERVVKAMLAAPNLSDSFDSTDGRLLFDAAMSPYSAAACAIIDDRRVVWHKYSAHNILQLLKDGYVTPEVRQHVLSPQSAIFSLLDADSLPHYLHEQAY